MGHARWIWLKVALETGFKGRKRCVSGSYSVFRIQGIDWPWCTECFWAPRCCSRLSHARCTWGPCRCLKRIVPVWCGTKRWIEGRGYPRTDPGSSRWNCIAVELHSPRPGTSHLTLEWEGGCLNWLMGHCSVPAHYYIAFEFWGMVTASLSGAIAHSHDTPCNSACVQEALPSLSNPCSHLASADSCMLLLTSVMKKWAALTSIGAA